MITCSERLKLPINMQLHETLQLYRASENQRRKRIATALQSFLDKEGRSEVEKCNKRGNDGLLRIKRKWNIPVIESSGKLNFQNLDMLEFYEAFRDSINKAFGEGCGIVSKNVKKRNQW